jgi:primosomal protein N'
MEASNQYIDVILPLPLPGFFTYKVPDELQNQIFPGCRVIVSLELKNSILLWSIKSMIANLRITR